MKKYISKCLVKHNGKRYPEGSPIELEDEYANPLLETNAIEINPETIGGGGTPVQGNANPDEIKVPIYAEMTNTQQVEYLSALSDEDFSKRFGELILISKSKSKEYAKKRFKSINSEN